MGSQVHRLVRLRLISFFFRFRWMFRPRTYQYYSPLLAVSKHDGGGHLSFGATCPCPPSRGVCAVVYLAHPLLYGGRTSVAFSLKWETHRSRQVEPEELDSRSSFTPFSWSAPTENTHSLLDREQFALPGGSVSTHLSHSVQEMRE